MLPWWRGFNGTIKKTGDNKFEVTGVARKVNDTTVEITELPIHKWTQTFKAELEAMCGEKGEGPIKVRRISTLYLSTKISYKYFRITKNIMTIAMSISLSR